mgnify:CR=1 FL=1
MADNNSFSKFVPGFDFLQGLVKNAGAALPGIGQWVAPTLNPEELGKRIEELRTVQFWLEQNARMLESVLSEFGVTGEIVKVRPGPVVTLYELEPAPGTKSSRACVSIMPSSETTDLSST